MTISKLDHYKDSSFYVIDEFDYKSFVVSHPDSRKLLNNPEVTGIQIYNSLKKPTENILNFITNKYDISRTNILNIMRGGLNFPIEESCFNLGINREAVSFVTTERVFEDNTIFNVDIKYNKIVLLDDATLILGDIIASGETIWNTILSIIRIYRTNNIKLKRIIVLTIGTINALSIIKKISIEISKLWDDFEGVIPFFYEGVFSVYKCYGITRLNHPKIDFLINGAFICPEYRYSILKSDSLLFEKCPIYDGGTRRFEPHAHRNTILTYWENLSHISNNINLIDFIAEKLGYNTDCTFDDWQKNNNYVAISNSYNLYCEEIGFLQSLNAKKFIDSCNMRYEYLRNYYKKEFFF